MPWKSCFFTDGQLEGGDSCPESVVQLLEDVGEIGPFPVELVHEDEARDPELGRRLPENLGLHLDAVDGAHHEHRQVGHGQSGQRFRHEVRVPRAVQDVDLVATPLEGGQGERGRHVMGVFFGLEVRDGGAVLHPARPVRRAAAQQQGLGQRRLAGAPVADEGHVADLRWWVRLHASTSFFPRRVAPSVFPFTDRSRPFQLSYPSRLVWRPVMR